MPLLIALLVFIVVALAAFVAGSLIDERNARARLIKDRLATVQKAPERDPNEELALLRDEQLSKIPALDTLLRRSARVSAIQEALTQAGMKLPARNFMPACVRASWMAETRAERRSRVSRAGILLSCSSRRRASSSLGSRSGALSTVARRSLMSRARALRSSMREPATNAARATTIKTRSAISNGMASILFQP